jgi:hypothetical protein
VHWRSDGTTIRVVFSSFESTECSGTVDSPTSATLEGCFVLGGDSYAVEGQITLAPQGTTLTVDPVGIAFLIGSCPVRLYQGQLIEVVAPAAER